MIAAGRRETDMNKKIVRKDKKRGRINVPVIANKEK
jgi:hypothetical protein